MPARTRRRRPEARRRPWLQPERNRVQGPGRRVGRSQGRLEHVGARACRTAKSRGLGPPLGSTPNARSRWAFIVRGATRRERGRYVGFARHPWMRSAARGLPVVPVSRLLRGRPRIRLHGNDRPSFATRYAPVVLDRGHEPAALRFPSERLAHVLNDVLRCRRVAICARKVFRGGASRRRRASVSLMRPPTGALPLRGSCCGPLQAQICG